MNHVQQDIDKLHSKQQWISPEQQQNSWWTLFQALTRWKIKRLELYGTCTFGSSTWNECESYHKRRPPKEGGIGLFLSLQQRELGFIEVVILIGWRGINPETKNKCCNNGSPEEVSHSGFAAGASLWQKQHTDAQLAQQKKPEGRASLIN